MGKNLTQKAKKATKTREIKKGYKIHNATNKNLTDNSHLKLKLKSKYQAQMSENTLKIYP